MTAHRAQGATVDRSFVLGSDELYREWGYTALTRHREDARFYVNDEDGQLQLPGLDEDERGAPAGAGAMARSRAKELASDLLERAEAPDWDSEPADEAELQPANAALDE